MILGIDAFNISRGGGITHLIEFLKIADPTRHNFDKVFLWAGESTLAQIEDRPWLYKRQESLLNRSLFFRVFWHIFIQRRRALACQCDVVFAPGGTAVSGFSPVMTMCRNMLPFEWPELRRYGYSATTLKLLLLRWIQAISMRRAAGVIFLSNYARRVITGIIPDMKGRVKIIPHGVGKDFFDVVPASRSDGFSVDYPCRVLYVSTISPYKHHEPVVRAISQLRSDGLPVVLDLVGAPDQGMTRLMQLIDRVDVAKDFVFYHGEVPHSSLGERYAQADIGVFASTCENMPNILLELMAAGLPIACSRVGPMPEVLADAGEYFDPQDPSDIARALRKLIGDEESCDRYREKAKLRASEYSWNNCTTQTLRFLASIAKESQRV